MKKICIIGGGAAGLACAAFLGRKGCDVTVLERGARLGRKLSATGNGQGNVTNTAVSAERYFSDDREAVKSALARFGAEETVSFLESMGGIFLSDARGRVYPASKQASAVTDLFRRELDGLKIHTVLNAHVKDLAYQEGFKIVWAEGRMRADAVILAAGGAAAPSFGTDGNAYALAQAFGHTLVPTRPVLVQLRCDKEGVRGLKGIRVDALVRVLRQKKELYRCRGDVLFTDCGVSGDAVFRASSYAQTGDELLLDFLPDVSRKRLARAIESNQNELLCIVNNTLARTIQKRANGDMARVSALVKEYPLGVTGTLGFDCAQVTRGGIPLCETDASFQSKKRAGLYFAGEILNVDGECGGYNLQWAFTSAFCVSEAISRA